jgi:hypothetical protein
VTHLEDFTPQLRAALSELEAAGLSRAAQHTRERCFCTYTTSSEWLGEVGEALVELLGTSGVAVPESARSKLEYCLAEVAKVWPKYQPR